MNGLKITAAAGLLAVACALAPGALGAGADVQYSGLGGPIANHGAVGGVRAYTLGSNTCNIGDAPLAWNFNSTPGLSMNAYRLHNGRIQQIGVGMVKTACCVFNTPSCGATECNGPGGTLNVGCMDTYDAGWNSIQSNLAPRSTINPFTGTFGTIPSFTGNATIGRRLQVAESDMSTTTYPGALYFVEGQYICTEDAGNGNWTNNASYSRVNVSAGFAYSATGSFYVTRPAIYAWLDHGNGAGAPDNSVAIVNADVPGEGRFIVACKVSDNGDGTWHYEYAVRNFNSDRAGASFAVPIPLGAVVTNKGFSDVWYHDEDAVYSGTDWTSPRSGHEIRWASTQTHAQNPNANALRWGTMYNFWFDCDRPPVAGHGEIGLFKPPQGCQPAKVSFAMSVPAADCVGDIERNGAVDVDDLIAVILGWGPCACVHDCAADAVGGNNAVDVDDLIAVILNWGGCE